MKKETKNAIIVNSTIVALTLSIITTIIGFAGGVCKHDTNIYKWIVGCGLGANAVLYVVKVVFLESLGATNKIVKITCVILIIIAVVLFICYVSAHFSVRLII